MDFTSSGAAAWPGPPLIARRRPHRSRQRRDPAGVRSPATAGTSFPSRDAWLHPAEGTQRSEARPVPARQNSRSWMSATSRQSSSAALAHAMRLGECASGGRNPVAEALERGYGRRVPDAIFAHPRLAPLYDAFDADRDDLTAYLGIADELGADRVLDVGCGTGCLAVLLAESGRIVVGVDPAGASLEVTKSKDEAARVTWVNGDVTAVPAFGADLAVMTGNVAQVFLTDADWAQALQG